VRSLWPPYQGAEAFFRLQPGVRFAHPRLHLFSPSGAISPRADPPRQGRQIVAPGERQRTRGYGHELCRAPEGRKKPEPQYHAKIFYCLNHRSRQSWTANASAAARWVSIAGADVARFGEAHPLLSDKLPPKTEEYNKCAFIIRRRQNRSRTGTIPPAIDDSGQHR
jgi:hypothetical protein